MEQQEAGETPLEDLRNSALAEYELAASAIHSWNNFIVRAIENYDPESNRLEKLEKNDLGQQIEKGFLMH